jgi:long-subunit fatty acid transport protein
VSTPTWYKLTTRNTTRIGDVDQIGYDADFRFYTPWKFGLSVGHTIGNFLALGASYEFVDYTTNDMRTITGRGYDWDGYYHEQSSSDREMKRLTQNTLRGVSTVKVGAEFKVSPQVALRAGYNYVSPMYKENGVRDQTIESPGTYMASSTDYTNWKATNRLTAGVGFTFDKLRLDLAYQYTMRKGDFYPYMHRGPENSNEPLSAKYYNEFDQMEVLKNECSAVSVKDNRHQLQCTLTYTW